MRTQLHVVAAVLAVLTVGWVAYRALFDSGDVAALTVLEAEGTVQRTHPTAGARAVAVGDALEARERVHVGEDGAVVLGVGAETRLRLQPDSTVEVVSVDADGVQVELEDGRVQARVRPGSPRLAISSGGRTLSAADADFTVGADGDVLAVEVDRGAVNATEGGTARPVIAGQAAVLVPGGAPVLQQGDADLLLEVQWPEAVTREAALRLEGRTSPGARVVVSGGPDPVEGRADRAGTFDLSVPLSEGANALRVRAWDPLGREVAVDGQAERDSEAPAARQVDVSWGG